ncbi:MAG TPA: hypothetical protein VF342_00385 [Alphaproteobacteria bacterium]
MTNSPAHLDRLVSDVLERSRAAGLDSPTAARRAVQAVRAVRPDLTPDEAWALVELLADRERRAA